MRHGPLSYTSSQRAIAYRDSLSMLLSARLREGVTVRAVRIAYARWPHDRCRCVTTDCARKEEVTHDRARRPQRPRKARRTARSRRADTPGLQGCPGPVPG